MFIISKMSLLLGLSVDRTHTQNHEVTLISPIHPTLLGSSLASFILCIYLLFSTVRTLASDNINTYTHSLNPIIKIKWFQNCYIHTTMKNKTIQRSAGFASHYFLPKPEVFDKNILHNLFILAPLQPSHPQCGCLLLEIQCIEVYLFLFAFSSRVLWSSSPPHPCRYIFIFWFADNY